jgi:hypothetical protein
MYHFFFDMTYGVMFLMTYCALIVFLLKIKCVFFLCLKFFGRVRMQITYFIPCGLKLVPETLADDGDPADVLVITPYPLIHDSVITVRPIGVLRMTDEADFLTPLLVFDNASH